MSERKRGLTTVCVVTAVALIAVALIISPLGSPGGFGLRSGSSTVKKTVRQLSENETEEVTTTEASGKTVWDWLSLLGVPLSLFALGSLFQIAQQRQAAAAAKEQREQAEAAAKEQREQAEAAAKEQREQAASETAEEALQIFFDRISILLVDKNLLGIAEKEDISSEQKELLDAAVDVIRARTLSILRRFGNDEQRKTSVIRFLIETEVINKLKLNLGGANLRCVDLIGANLSGASLRCTDLSGADLIHANLSGADLSNADLIEADLSSANLSDADLSSSDPIRANLSGADLSHANLSRATLFEADLSGASLRCADLSSADLSGADLICANLSGANLFEADLFDADLFDADMSKANMSKADLSKADLSKADLSGAKDLTASQLETALLCSTQLPEGMELDPNRDCKKLGIERP